MWPVGSESGIRVAARWRGGTNISLYAKSQWTFFIDVWWWLGLAFGKVDIFAWLRGGSVGVCGLRRAGVEV